MTDPNLPFSSDIERDPTHLAAAEWYVRLHSGEISIEDTLAWQRWLKESPANSLAFARIEEVSQVLRAVPAPSTVSARRFARDCYDASVPLKDWEEAHVPRRIWPAVALAASVAIIALAIFFWRASSSSSSTDTFTTAVGENRNVVLSDGSIVALGGDTRLEVALSKRVRIVELAKGEALFRVAKDGMRPFKVHAGDATIVAVGTAFNVRRASDHAIICVADGRVLVEPVAHFLPVFVMHEFMPKLRAVHLDAGEQTTVGSAGIDEPTKVPDPAEITAWQTGRLAFRLQPLRYVLEDVNRYAPKRIVLEGDNVGALLITGTVERANIAGWIKSLERAFDLRATEEPDRIVMRTR
jgi:transmembrane sensor